MASTETPRTISGNQLSWPPSGTQLPAPRRGLVSVVILPLLIFIVVAGAGGAYLLHRPAVWQSNVSLAILPRPSSDAADQASYYDTLSRGQIVSTAAKVADESVGHGGLPSVSVLVVPETSVITLTIKADSTGGASSVAATALTRAVGAINALKLPYEATVIDNGSSAPTKATPSIIKDAAVVIVIGLALAAIAQQLQAAAWRRKGR